MFILLQSFFQGLFFYVLISSYANVAQLARAADL